MGSAPAQPLLTSLWGKAVHLAHTPLLHGNPCQFLDAAIFFFSVFLPGSDNRSPPHRLSSFSAPWCSGLLQRVARVLGRPGVRGACLPCWFLAPSARHERYEGTYTRVPRPSFFLPSPPSRLQEPPAGLERLHSPCSRPHARVTGALCSSKTSSPPLQSPW